MGNSPAIWTYSNMTMDQPLPALNISFIKKEGFKPALKHREGVYTTDSNWELVPENRGLIAEGSASQITFRNPKNYQ